MKVSTVWILPLPRSEKRWSVHQQMVRGAFRTWSFPLLIIRHFIVVVAVTCLHLPIFSHMQAKHVGLIATQVGYRMMPRWSLGHFFHGCHDPSWGSRDHTWGRKDFNYFTYLVGWSNIHQEKHVIDERIPKSRVQNRWIVSALVTQMLGLWPIPHIFGWTSKKNKDDASKTAKTIGSLCGTHAVSI